MFKKNIDFNKCFKPVLIGYAVFMVIGIILTAMVPWSPDGKTSTNYGTILMKTEKFYLVMSI